MKRTFTSQELALLAQGRLIGDPELVISGVDALECAGKEDASFLANMRYREAMDKSQAGLICVPEDFEAIPGRNLLLCKDPSAAFQTIVHALLGKGAQSGFQGVHPTAVIHPSAKLAEGVSVGPYAVIDRDVTIGAGTYIGPFVSIGPEVEIGEGCLLHSHAVVREGCILRNRVILQPGAVIGSCGFGYTTDATTGCHTKLQHVGGVEICDDVEIGANTAIDRARFKTTRIAEGTKIDNLVQIAHNVQVGPHNLIISQVGIAGSTKTGRNVVLAGQVGIIGHLEIGDGVMIAAQSGVSKSLPPGTRHSGSPTLPISEHNRQQVHLRKIADYVKRIQELEKRLEALEKC